MKAWLMMLVNSTPNEFGLKVREHPGNLLITARNKMKSAETRIDRVDLWGKPVYMFKYKNDNEVNNRNLHIATQFIEELSRIKPKLKEQA